MHRHLRILLRFWKNSLIREMSFRGHFLVNAGSEVMWVVGLLIFINLIYGHTSSVAGWSEHQYLVLVGTHMIVTSLFETFFFENCWNISRRVRTGDLDFVLVRPASTQMLLSCERVSYSSLAGVAVGIGICLYALNRLGVAVSASTILLYALLILAGLSILYSLLFIFSITSVWLIRQTGVDHLWFYAVSLARYPAEMYKPFVGGALFFALVYVMPVLMVSNLPASVMVRAVDPFIVVYIVAASITLLFVSAAVLRFALRSYRSASS